MSKSTHTWIKSSSDQSLVLSAVKAGDDADGSPIYVGRTLHEGDQLPVNVIPLKQIAYVSHNGQEIRKLNFEVLSGHSLVWESSSNGQVPKGAISTGTTRRGEAVYVGRAVHERCLVVGKVIKSLGALYLPFNGREHAKKQYEVLVMAQGLAPAPAPARSQWILTSIEAPLPTGAIQGGNDDDGSPIYIGRTLHKGEHVIVKVIPKKKIGYFSYDGKEISVQKFEVLCNGNVFWVVSDSGRVVPHAVPGGQTLTGETLYIGRAPHSGSLTVGKVHPSHRSLYIAYGGKEIPIQLYEVLVEK